MKILFLADSNSPHTLRWVKSLSNNSLSLGVFSIHKPDSNLYNDSPNIFLSTINVSRDLQKKPENNISKLIYLKAVKKVRQLIKEFNPDIVHSHYASSYGLIGALTGFHPYIISVWGADIYNFPNYSFLHKFILSFSLSRADKILSTSKVMRKETKKYTNKEVTVTPFGIDTERFFPQKQKSLFNNDDIIIGTIKTLEKKYGIEYLIRAFELVKKRNPEKKLKLLIVGGGTQELFLKSLVRELKIENDTIFTGYVNYNEVQTYHNMLDIYVSASIEDSESFGVAVLEASACSKPVIVSNVGGLPEVVSSGKTGYIIEPKNYKKLAEIIDKLICEPELRKVIGQNGRKKVLDEYKWEDCIGQMISIYNEVTK